MIDACAAQADDAGTAPRELHTRTVAEHVLRIYLPQARLYLGGDGDPMQSRQIGTDRSAALGAVLRLHLLAEERRLRTGDQISRRLPDECARCLDEVERTFARYPLRPLQVVAARIDHSSTTSIRAHPSASRRSTPTTAGSSGSGRPLAITSSDSLRYVAP